MHERKNGEKRRTNGRETGALVHEVGHSALNGGNKAAFENDSRNGNVPLRKVQSWVFVKN